MGCCQCNCSQGSSLPEWPSMQPPIDTVSKLSGTAQPYHAQILYHTDSLEWPQDIGLIEDKTLQSLSSEIKRHNREKPDRKVLIQATTLASASGKKTATVFPRGITIAGIGPDNAPAMINFAGNSMQESDSCFDFDMTRLESKAFVFVCGHQARDNRCGVAGPILQEHFKHHSSSSALGGAKIETHLISHIGGHKFAGNVIVYRRRDDGEGYEKGIWYGRVTPAHVPQILQETVVAGKIIPELFRG